VGRLRYIVFSGMDGSGKTTKALFTRSFLNTSNIKSTYVWFRWNAYISYFVLFIAKIIKLTIKVNINNQLVFIRRYYANKVLAYLWILTQLMDIIITHVFSIVRAKLYGARIIIYDRFAIPDKIVDLIYETRINLFKTILVRALIYYFLSMVRNGSMLIIFNKISPDKVLRIRKDLPSVNYPYMYDRLYTIILKIISGSNNMLILDSERSLNENLLSIARKLSMLLHHEG
jgi:hypothetical protein